MPPHDSLPDTRANPPTRANPSFDEADIARLKLAAEEVAWLTGRGYAVDAVGALVARHHGLGDGHRSALARGTCSEPQYRRRAAREVEMEDVARRPLAVDAIDVVETVEAALDGRPVLQTLDGTVRSFGACGQAYVPSARTSSAVERLLVALKDLRPSLTTFYVDASAPGAEPLEACIVAAAKAQKAKVQVARVPSVSKVLRKERQIVTGDAATLDTCIGWFNLAGRVVEAIAGAKIVKLQ